LDGVTTNIGKGKEVGVFLKDKVVGFVIQLVNWSAI